MCACMYVYMYVCMYVCTRLGYKPIQESFLSNELLATVWTKLENPKNTSARVNYEFVNSAACQLK